MMKSIVKALFLLLIILNAGCGDDKEAVKTENPILKIQADALNNARQADRIIQESAAKQREIIDAEGGAEQD